MESRGFAIPFLMVAVGYMLWDIGAMVKYFFFKRTEGIPEEIVKMPTATINEEFKKVSTPLLKKY
jgi:hypothetical protein